MPKTNNMISEIEITNFVKLFDDCNSGYGEVWYRVQ